MSGIVTPFQNEVALEQYFPGKEFERILSRIEQIFHQKSTLMVLTGEEGTGKTMLCMRLADVKDGCKPVFFPDTVESFRDVVCRIAGVLGLVWQEEVATNDIVEDIITTLSAQSVPVLLVFDQAENLYLATLERIRRLFGRFCDAEVTLHVLFSGRPAFLRSYEQLAICNFPEITEEFFSLAPLSRQETEEYLLYTAARNPGYENGTGAAFDKEFVQQLFQATSGNLRAINRFAHRRLEHPDGNSSFLTLLQEMEEAEDGDNRGERFFEKWWRWVLRISNSWKKTWQGRPSAHRKALGLTICGVVLLVAVISLLPGENVEEKGRGEQKPESFTAQESADISMEARIEKPAEESSPVVVEVVRPPVEEERVPEKKDTAAVAVPGKELAGENVASQAPETGDEEASEHSVAGSVMQQKGEGTETPPVILPLHTKLIVQDVAETGQQPEAVLPAGEKILEAEEKIVVLYPSKESKYRDHVEGRPLEGGKVTELERLVQNRFVAGMSWRSGSKDQLYTIQLARLQGTDAMNRLNEFFTVPRYRSLVTDFYLFSKGLHPESVFVYYGEFGDEGSAATGLQTISQKFPAYTPFVISIKDAMDGIRTNRHDQAR